VRGQDPLGAPPLLLGLVLGKITRCDHFRCQSRKIVRFLERLNSPIVVVAALVVFLVLDGFLLYRYQQSLQSTRGGASNAPVEEASPSPKVEPTTAEETTAALKGGPTTAEETTSPSSQAEQGGGVQVLVSVVNEPIGLSVMEDGQVVHDQVTNPGFSEEFEAEEAITVGAADGGAVQVGVNGENSEPLGPSGEPTGRTFTPED
jgi:cytoskeleton protein RodZ